MLLPTRCPVCGVIGPAPCGECRAALRPAASLPCPPGLDRCAALLDYEGAGREVLARLKYRNARSSLPFLADGMAALVDPATVDAVCWVPTSAARRRARGFDQAELLARAVARRLGRPARPLLRRRRGPPQTGRSVADRRAHGPRYAPRRRPPPRVLLVDDVVTTGASVAAAARALRAAGAREVQVVAGARTRPRAVHSGMTVCGSVVESRGQPQAKRPT
jgi:ComF family protein